MYLTIISWIYITLLCYIIGVAVNKLLYRLFNIKNEIPHFSLTCLTGMLAISFESVVLSLFIPLDRLSNGIILIITALAGFISRKNLSLSVKSGIKNIRDSHWLIILIAVAYTLIIGYLSYMPSSHYDDGLYYSTTIKWLQEYGAVKGLANLNPRIAFNSVWHILQANFGFRFLNSGLLNDMNGLIFVLVFFYSLGGVNNLIKRKDNTIFNGLRALLLMPVLVFHFGASSDIILFNINFLGSTSPDIPICLLIWTIMLLLLKNSNRITDGTTIEDILIILYAVWTLTIKLSASPIILVCFYIIIKLIKGRKYKQFVLLCIICIVFVTPWIIRNILLSGYLLFPFSGADFFNVPWKIPIKHVKWFENAVKASALGADLNHTFDTPFSKWFPEWYSKLFFIRQLVLGVAFIASVNFALVGIVQLLKKNITFFKQYQREIVFVTVSVFSIFFWLSKGPDFRFGYGFLSVYGLFFIVIITHYGVRSYFNNIYVPIIAYSLAISVFYYKGTWTDIRHHFFSAPLTYRMPTEIKTTTISNGVKLHLVTHDDTWNMPLPAASIYEYGVLNTDLLDRTIQKGFKSTK